MVQLDISLIPESMRRGVQPIVDVVDDHTMQLGVLQRNRVATTSALDALRKDQLAFRRYQPMLDQLQALGLDGLVTSLEDAIAKFSESPQFESIMAEILAEALKAPVAEVGKMFTEVQDKIGAVKLDQDALIARVDRLVGRVDTHDTRLDGHDKDILGLKATTEGLATQVAVIEKNGGGRIDTSNEAVFGLVLGIVAFALYGLAWLFVDKGFSNGKTFVVCFLIALPVALISAYAGKKGKQDSSDSNKLSIGERLSGKSKSTAKTSSTPPSPAPAVANSTQPAPTPVAAGSPSNN